MQDHDRIEELQKNLDQLALQSLEIIEELLEERRKFDQLLRNGFFQITQARHIMGSKSVSSLQLPVDGGPSIKALAKVNRTVRVENLIETFSYEIVSEVRAEGAEVKTNNVLKKRGGKKEELVTGEYSGEPPLSNPATKKGVKDPLNWFGVLVPRSLRDSQNIFRHGLLYVCKVASLQTDLENVRKRFKELYKEWEQIKLAMAK